MNLLKALTLMAALVAVPAMGQPYPSKPIRIVVPFPAGGGADFHARLLSEKMSELLEQPVIVDNRAGASGNIGANAVAKAAPDGYTLLLGGAHLTIAPAISAQLPYDVVKDLEPVAQIARLQNVLVVRDGSPIASVEELIRKARSEPGKLNYASSGSGASPHLAMELLRNLAKVNIVHVAYKGDQPAVTDLLGGHVDVYFSPMAAALPHVRAGKFRALGVSARTRSPVLPDVPTVAEAGVSGYELASWFGVLAPAQTPAAVVKKLNGVINQVLAMPDVRQRLVAAGSEPLSTTPEEFIEVVRSDVKRYAEIARSANIRPE